MDGNDTSHFADEVHDIPIEDEIFQPNPLIVADIIFDEPTKTKQTARTTKYNRRGSEVVMDYTRHPLPQDTGQHHRDSVGVHFEDGKTPRLKSYEGPTSVSPHSQPYAPQQQPPYNPQHYAQPQPRYMNASYPPPFQQAPYFPPPPTSQPQLQGSAPIPIPSARRGLSMSDPAASQPYGSPQQMYGSPGSYPAAPPPQQQYGSWPHPGYIPPPPPGQSYLPGPGAPTLPWSQQPPFGPPGTYTGGPYDPRGRTGSASTYNSTSSHRWGNGRDDSPMFDSDEESEEERERRRKERKRRHSEGHHSHHHGRDKGERATLGDTLALIWDGLSGNVKRR